MRGMRIYPEIEEMRRLLLEFIERATKKGATQTEVEALPKVAQVLVDSFRV